MFRLATSILRARKTRALLAAAAITLGVAFMSATMVLTDSLGRTVDDVTASATAGTDAVVRSDRAETSSNTNATVRAPIGRAVFDVVRRSPGVSSAEPDVNGIAQIVRADGELLDDNANRPTPLALTWHRTAALNPMRLTSGHAPGADEVVIDRRSADIGQLQLGNRVGVLTQAGSQQFTISGIATYAGHDDAAGAHVTAFAPATAAKLLGRPGQYDSIRVAAAPGTSAQQLIAHLRSSVAAANAADVEVVTGAKVAKEARDKAQGGLNFLSFLLTAFALVSLLVGAMVIANAFAINAAQRTRENALLRALGAKRRQVTRAVVAEAALTGLMASALGIGVGIGLAKLLHSLVQHIGVPLPDAPLVVHGRVILIGLLVGTLVTVIASYLPARRSGRTAPIAAMRAADPGAVERRRMRTTLGTLVTGIGLVASVTGFQSQSPGRVGLGSLATFIGVVMLGPVIAPFVVRAIGAPIRRFAGITGEVAVRNARRNPRRTSSTASSLMVGLGLISFMIVFSTSARASFAALVDDGLRGDWIVSTVFGQGGVSTKVAADIERLPESGPVSPLRYTVASVDGKSVDVSGTNTATIEKVYDGDVVAGHMSDVGRNDIAVRQNVARSHHWKLGDTVAMSFPTTGAQRFTIAAIYKTQDPLGPYSLSLPAFAANSTTAVDDYVFVSKAAGVSTADAKAAIEKVLAAYPTAKLQTGPEFAADATTWIRQLLALIDALLALAVLIALFGIMNTLALSVHERTRELGLLRAIGMDRQQVRAAVRYEAVTVSLFGTIVGILVGVGSSVALMHALRSQGLDRLSVPVLPLLAVLAIGAIAGVLCATMPARRASRVNVLQALHAD
jgi:putative ABC transport system permease protein